MMRAALPIGAALAILGFFGPWVVGPRQIAALTLNALDLTEFAKFMVRARQAGITRELFVLPILAAALMAALWCNLPDRLPRAWRYGLTLVSILLSLVPLPPYPFVLTAYASVEDRGLFWLSSFTCVGVLLAFALGHRLPGRWRGIAFFALALIGALPAAFELLGRALPAFSLLYGSPAAAGWGFGITLLGFALVGVVGLDMLRHR